MVAVCVFLLYLENFESAGLRIQKLDTPAWEPLYRTLWQGWDLPARLYGA